MESQSSSTSSIDNRLQKLPKISNEIDRLSDLPDSLICHILSLLPTEMVVATSTLAKRWKSVWKKVTSVDVSYHPICGSEGEDSDSARFAQIVNKVLLFRNAMQLHRFWVDWEIESEQEAEYVNMWVSYAIARHLQSCSLRLGDEMSEVNLPAPDALFTSKTLEFLELFGCFTLQVPTLVCLPKLQELTLYDLHGSDETDESIQKLTSGCPMLHSLSIRRTGKFAIALKISSFSLRHLVVSQYAAPGEVPVYDTKLEIDAPNLEYLDLQVYLNDCSIKCPSALLNVAVLELGKNGIADSYADFVNGIYNDRCNSTVKLFETLKRAKSLYIFGDTMMAISRATIPFSTRFERLTKLNIYVPCCEWSSLSVILGCCNSLQSFSIRVIGSCDETHKRCWKDPEQVPECLLTSLASVSFKLFKGLEDEMSMVRYFLKHGSVLVSLDVSADPSISDKKFQMLQAISEFPRLSSDCSVKFA